MKKTPLLPRPWPSPFTSEGVGPLDVQLRAAESILRVDAAAAGRDGQDAVGDFPWRRRVALVADPLRQVLAVEEHDRIRRRRAGRGAGRDDRRLLRRVGHLSGHPLLLAPPPRRPAARQPPRRPGSRARTMMTTFVNLRPRIIVMRTGAYNFRIALACVRACRCRRRPAGRLDGLRTALELDAGHRRDRRDRRGARRRRSFPS